MSYATKVPNLHVSPHVHKRLQVDDNFQKTKIEYDNLVIKNEKRAVKGIILGLIFSIPIWFLIINFII
jgi:hypothetical protein